jgi:hypothetical protein
MAKIRIKGDTSGYVDIQAPAVAGATTINTSNIVTQDSDGTTAFTNDVTVTGNVGIGTGSPTRALHVYNATVNGVALFESGDQNGGIALSDNSTTEPVYLLADGNNFDIQTNGVERFRIDSSGRVTMPYQPAFRGENAGDTSFSSDIIISTQNTWTAPLNRGSVFDTSNGRFTAPIDGVYLISYGITVSGTTDLSGDGWSAILYKNGTAFSDQEYNYESGSRNGEEGHSGNTIAIELSANDYLQVGSLGIGGSAFIFRYATLSGFLIG